MTMDKFLEETDEPGIHDLAYRPRGSYGMVLFGNLDDGTPVAVKLCTGTLPEFTNVMTYDRFQELPWTEAQIMCAVGLHVNHDKFGLNAPLDMATMTTRLVAAGSAVSTVPWIHKAFVMVLSPRFHRTSYDYMTADNVAHKLYFLNRALEVEREFLEATGCTHGDLHSSNLAYSQIYEPASRGLGKKYHVILTDFGRVAPTHGATPVIREFYARGATNDWSKFGGYWTERIDMVAYRLWPSMRHGYARAMLQTQTLYMILASFMTDDVLCSRVDWTKFGEKILPLVQLVNDDTILLADKLNRLSETYPPVLLACAQMAEQYNIEVTATTKRERAHAKRERTPSPLPPGKRRRVDPSITHRVNSRVEYVVHRDNPRHPLKPRIQWRLRIDPPAVAPTLHFIG